MDKTSTKKPAQEDDAVIGGFRLRLGIGMWLLSWVPFASAVVVFAQDQGWVSSGQQAHRLLMALWAVQITIGFIGIFIAGSEAITLVKSYGLRNVPKQAWRIIIGKDITK